MLSSSKRFLWWNEKYVSYRDFQLNVESFFVIGLFYIKNLLSQGFSAYESQKHNQSWFVSSQKHVTLKRVTCNSFPWNKAGDFLDTSFMPKYGQK